MTIPEDLANWNPADVTEWLSSIEDDETVTDDEFRKASQAVTVALLG